MKYCKNCGSRRHIYDSRLRNGAIVRRCKCTKCGRTWMTIEVDYWEYMREHQKEGDDNT